MNYEQIEDACIGRLAPLGTAGITIQQMPQTVAEYQKPPVDRPSIIVAYIGSQFDANDGKLQFKTMGSATVQEEWAQIELTLRSRTLRGPGGIHDLAARARALLLGWDVPGVGKLALKTYTYFAFVESVWVYKLVFQCIGLVQEIPDEQALVLVTQITVDTITVQSPT